MIFDTHTHAYFPELLEREEEVLSQMKHANVAFATQIACDFLSSVQAVTLAKNHTQYFASV